jgi:hypothetical protein
MAFEDDFAACMTNGGIQLDASAVPDEETFAGVLDYLNQWFQGLDPDIQAALDEATDSDPVNKALTESEVGAIDSTYSALLEAFDAASGVPLSTCLEWCQYCLEQARASAAE